MYYSTEKVISYYVTFFKKKIKTQVRFQAPDKQIKPVKMAYH